MSRVAELARVFGGRAGLPPRAPARAPAPAPPPPSAPVAPDVPAGPLEDANVEARRASAAQTLATRRTSFQNLVLQASRLQDERLDLDVQPKRRSTSNLADQIAPHREELLKEEAAAVAEERLNVAAQAAPTQPLPSPAPTPDEGDEEIKNAPDDRGGTPGVSGGARPTASGSRGSLTSSVASVPPTLESLPELARQIGSGVLEKELFATMSLRVMLSHHVSWIDKIVQLPGLVPRLVSFLSRDDQRRLQFEACWALTNIASGTSVHTQMVLTAGAVPPLITLLNSPQVEIREQAVWAIGNVAGDSPDARDEVLRAGVLPVLVRRLDAELGLRRLNQSFLRSAVWAVANLCRGKPTPDFSTVRAFIPILGRVLRVNDVDMQADACWALNYLGDGEPERVQALIDEGVCPPLVELLDHEAHIIKGPALRAVGNIVTGDDTQTDHVLGLGTLDKLRVLVRDPRHTIRGEACWTVSNVTAGNPGQIQRVLDAGLIPPLLDCCRENEPYVAKEAVWAVTNVTTGGTPEQVEALARAGCIGALVAAMRNAEELNNRVIIVALEGLANLLSVGDLRDPANNEFVRVLRDVGGAELLKDSLRHHVNDDIRAKAHELVVRFIDYVADPRPAKPPPEMWTPEEVAAEKERKKVEMDTFSKEPTFYCPISQEVLRNISLASPTLWRPHPLTPLSATKVMADPVSTVDGHVYDRVNIQRWFNTGKMTSPVTGDLLDSLALVPNHPIRQMIESFRPGYTHRADLDTEWSCVACTSLNKPTDCMCLVCGAEKPPRRPIDPDAVPAVRRLGGA